ncbi:27 kDa hemolymph protein [Musca autumnalis]|uniref:27 kDa hemolymph protein n=1 Tax=Musca autumnalis TaxID=221902 RepID=UPI003CF48860
MLKLRLVVVTAVALAGVFLMSQTPVAANDQIEQLKNQFMPAQFRNASLTEEDLKKIFKEKCKKASGVDNSTLYQEVEKGSVLLVACLSGLANLTALQQEIEVARPLGELDTVFHKHCQKAPAAEKCFREFNTVIQPCLSPEEKSQNAVMVRIVSGLLGFMCARGGDQIALFVAEDGPECLQANKEAIAHCANKSFTEFTPKNQVTDLFNLPDFTLEPEHCVDLAKFEACTLHHLEQCQEITPANVAESVFKFVKNETSCKAFLEGKTKPRSILKEPKSSASPLQISAVATFMGLFFAIYANYFL